MTSTTDTAGHPDVAELSELTEGLLTPTRSADVRRHLDECELCADVHASLEEIRGLLGSLPGPPRMPDDVAGRIDAALAAEALLSATAPEPVDAPGPDHNDDLDTPPALAGTHVSRETSVSADRPAGHARASSTGPGRKGRSRGGRRRIAVLGTVFTVAALGLGSVLLSSFNDGKPSDPTAQADAFSGKQVEPQVSELLTQGSSVAGSRSPRSFGANTVPENHVKNQPAPQVPSCVLKGIGRDDTALAAKKGTYDGDPAYLVVMLNSKDTSRVDAYVVDASCEKDPSSSAKVLLTHSYARSTH